MSCSRGCGENILTHTDGLATLPWKKKGDLCRHSVSLPITCSLSSVRRPDDCDTYHNWDKRDVSAVAFCTADRQSTVARSGDDVIAAYLDGRVKLVVLVVLP